jgi:hypothetical protein
MAARQVLQTAADQDATAVPRFIGIGEIHILFRQERAQMFVDLLQAIKPKTVEGLSDGGAGGSRSTGRSLCSVSSVRLACSSIRIPPCPARTQRRSAV